MKKWGKTSKLGTSLKFKVVADTDSAPIFTIHLPRHKGYKGSLPGTVYRIAPARSVTNGEQVWRLDKLTYMGAEAVTSVEYSQPQDAAKTLARMNGYC